MSAIIQCHRLAKTLTQEQSEQIVLPAVNLTVHQGDMLAITGSSGSGKSTLLNIIGLLDQATSGQYILHGQDITHLDPQVMAIQRQKTFGYVFQQYWLIKQLTVLENVQLPLHYAGRSMNESREHCMQLLQDLHIADYADRYPQSLSGGQQQRVSIARALANNPKVLLADEPTGALDKANTEGIISVLQKLRQTLGTTIIMVTHDSWVAQHCPKQANIESLLVQPKLPQRPILHGEVLPC